MTARRAAALAACALLAGCGQPEPPPVRTYGPAASEERALQIAEHALAALPDVGRPFRVERHGDRWAVWSRPSAAEPDLSYVVLIESASGRASVGVYRRGGLDAGS